MPSLLRRPIGCGFLVVAALFSSVAPAAPGDLDLPFMAEIEGNLTGADRGFSRPVNAVLALPDGKTLVGGSYGTFRGANPSVLWVLNPDGSLDRALGPFAVPTGQPEVNVLVAQPDGQILVGGVFQSFDGVLRQGVLRLRADLSLDPDFVEVALSGTNRYVAGIAVQGDGRILIGGGFAAVHGASRRGLARLLPNGALDLDFLPPRFDEVYPGFGTFPGVVDDIAIQPDGAIVVSGAFNRVDNRVQGNVARLRPDGRLDTSFQIGAGADLRLNRVAVQADGKILLGGLAQNFNGQPVPYLFRLNVDGSIDAEFSANQGSASNGWMGGDILVLPDGSILGAGIFNSFNGQPIASIVKLAPDGTPDFSFAPQPFTNDRGKHGTHVYSLALQDDGKLVAGGWMNDHDSLSGGAGISLRINDTPIHNLARFVGDFDNGPGRILFPQFAYVGAENDGSITVTARRVGGIVGAATVDYAITPLTATAGSDYTAVSGTLSWPAGQGGYRSFTVPVLNDELIEGTEVATLSLGNATGAALGAPAEALLTILDDDNPPVILVDPASLSVIQGDAAFFAVAVQSVTSLSFQWLFNGEEMPGQTFPFLIIGGVSRDLHQGSYSVRVTNAAGFTVSASATLTVTIPAGSIDPTFANPGLANATRVQLLADGSYLALANGILRRVLANGTIDVSFTAITGDASNPIVDFAVDAEGRILVVGPFNSIVGQSRARLARFTAEGTFDSTFFSPYNTSGPYVSQIHISASGQIYIGLGSGGGVRRLQANGNFDNSYSITVGGGNQGYIHLLTTLSDGRVAIGSVEGGFGSITYRFSITLANGSLDPSFPSVITNNQVLSLAELPDGRVAIGGNFSTLNGLARLRLAILTASGAVDLGFDPGSTFLGGSINALQYLDGRLLVGGTFTGTYNNLARLNLDASVDLSFALGAGFNGTVRDFTVGADGRIVIAGGFTSYRGRASTGLVRLVRGPDAIGLDPLTPSIQETAGSVTFTVRRYGSGAGALSADYTTTDGTAIAGEDYVATSGSLNWTEGDFSTREISVTLVNDSVAETITEAFTLNLSNLVGLESPAFAGATAVITVIDDDNPPVITSQPSSQSIAQGGNVTFSVVATSVLPLTYQWFLGEDEIDGATSASYTITGADTVNRGTYTVRVTNANGFAIASPAELTVLLAPTFLDEDFPTNLVTNGEVWAILPQRDDGAYIGGSFTNFGGVTGLNRLARINGDGVVDETFRPVIDGTVNRIVRDGDQLYVIGSFNTVDGVSTPRFAALDATTGARLTAFHTTMGAGTTSTVRGLALASDGSVYLGGDFTSFSSNFNHKYVARLQRDGSPHPAWNTSSATGNASFVVYDVAVDSLDRVLVGGGSINVGGGTRVVRLFPDGSRDPSFVLSASGTTSVNRVYALPDRRVMLTGTNIASNRSFAVVEEDGSYSTSTFFGQTSTIVRDAVQQHDGSFLNTGNISLIIPGGSSRGFARFTATGQYDNTFAKGSGLDGSNGGLVIALSRTGQIWLGGDFTAYNGTSSPRLARLNGVPIPLAIVEQPADLEVDPATTARFDVDAVGTSTLSYQWQRNGVALIEGGRLSGVHTATLEISGATIADNGIYTVLISNVSGSVVSREATLGVRGAPVFTAALPEALTGLTGRTLMLAASVRALAPVAFQWRRNGVPLANGNGVSGADTAVLDLSALTTDRSGRYDLVVTNALGTEVSTAVQVTIIPHPSDRVSSPFTALVANSSSITVRSILPLPDGGALVAGNFNFFTGLNSTQSGLRLARVRPNGEVLPSAQFNLTPNGDINQMIRLRNGDILVSGSFTALGGQPRAGLARLRADLSLDPDFNPGSGASTVNELAEDSQGRLYVGGTFANFAGVAGTAYVARLLPDGSVDTTFVSQAANNVNDLAVQADDRLLLAGNFTFYDGRSYFLRLNEDGSRDQTFNPFFTGSNAQAVLVQADGRIVYTNSSGTVFRVLPDGTNDPDFAIGTTPFNAAVTSLSEQPNGALVLSGTFANFGGTFARNRLARLRPDGSIDTVFNPEPGFTGSPTPNVWVVRADAYGRVWVGGTFGAYNNQIGYTGLVVLNGDQVDLGFTSEPADTAAEAGQTVALAALATGSSSISYQWYRGEDTLADGAQFSGTTTATLTIASLSETEVGTYRLVITNESGTRTSRAASVVLLGAPEVLTPPLATIIDLGYGASLTVTARGAGTLTYAWSRGGVPLEDGATYSGTTSRRLVIAGATLDETGSYEVTIINDLGQIVVVAPVTVLRRPGYAPGNFTAPSFGGNVNAFLPLPDGSVLVGGAFTGVNWTGGSATRRGLARMRLDGTIDPNFLNLAATSGAVNALLADAEGNIYIGGSLVGSGYNRLLRLRPVATAAMYERDPTFAPPLPASEVHDLAFDSEGRLVVAGAFQNLGGQAGTAYVGRLTLPAGTLDPSFTSLANNQVYTIHPEANGSLLLGGNFSSYDGANRIVRVTASGARDASFSTTRTFNARSFARDGGRLYVGGTSNPYLLGLDLATGADDASWSVPNYPTNAVNRVVVDARRRVYVGGNFTDIVSVSGPGYLVRYLPSGEHDSGFDLGPGGFNGAVNAIHLLPTGQLLVGGVFSTFQGASVGRFVLLNGDAPPTGGGFGEFLDTYGLTGADGQPGADPDADGRPNLLEFLLGTSPIAGDTGPGSATRVARLELADGVSEAGDYLLVDVRVRTDRVNLATVGAELAPTVATLLAGGGDAAVAHGDPVPDGDDHEIRTFRTATPMAGDAQIFLRLVLTPLGEP